MANPQSILAGNVPGEFFVDATCIDCDLCRQIAPASFREGREGSVVHRQPATQSERLRAEMALIACPTGSIGTQTRADLRAARQAFPETIEDNVYFCGFASRNSYGASSYLIVRPEGNILIDSPRFARPLVRRLEELGGVSRMLLTHQDDIADHERFHRHFGLERVIHEDDGRRTGVERLIRGREVVELEDDLRAIPTPGHTRGHVVFLYRDRFLFSGDHLAWSVRRQRLVAFRETNWYSWPETIRSMARLLEHRFEWVLPGHGRRVRFPATVMSRRLAECVEWMKVVA